MPLPIMPLPSYRFVIDLARPDGAALAQSPAEIDWAPAFEWGRLLALRRWRDPGSAAAAAVTVEPLWHATAGPPQVRCLRVGASLKGCPPVTDEIPLAYFQPLATKLAKSLVQESKLSAGDAFHYSVSAFPRVNTNTHADDETADFEDVPVPVPLGRASFSALRARSSVHGELDASDLSVFVPQRVVHELVERTEQAGAMEAGAFLLGRLHAASDGDDLFLEVTAQVPALHATAESTRLALTADTWNAVRNALALRRRQEQLVGWQHSHPAKFWCRQDCSAEARARCALGRPFFSSDDCAVHRTVFWTAHSVALLITHAPAEMNITMYAWRRGLIQPRGFYLLDPAKDAPGPAIASGEVASDDDSLAAEPCAGSASPETPSRECATDPSPNPQPML
jgi:hypothetical protein